jgi:adenylate cyclase class 1
MERFEDCIKDIALTMEENRQAFMRYTISRLRELLRNLPQNKLDLFHILPFLLHVNDRRFPGYVESDMEFCGLFRFERSGFFKAAVRLLKFPSADIAAILPRKKHILGLYLMGSAGTLTQTGRSDFDFWVIVREDRLGPDKMELLGRKIKAVEAWCNREHNQEVTFFIMDIEKLRHNEFRTVDGESSGSAQKTLLKDEFYRTFIMIAGKIPLWAVLPPELPRERIPEFLASAVAADVSMDNYIDTGHLSGIDGRECLGALLWQVYKARKDPVKSLIKSSLAAAYAFMDDDIDGLVSQKVRKRFSRASIDDFEDDPYTLVFETVMEFYEDMNDHDGLELVRQCIFLRLWSYPLMVEPDAQSPKGRLLKRFLERWKPERETLDFLTGFNQRCEEEKISFEEKIFDKLSFLYELVLRSADDDNVKLFMKKEDIAILRNRTAAFMRRKTWKIPRCSTWLKERGKTTRFAVTSVMNSGDRTVFVLHEKDQGPEKPVYSSPGYLGLMGFLFANSMNTALDDTPPYFGRIADYFRGMLPRPDGVFAALPHPEKTFVLLKAPSRTGDLESVDILSANSWGEFYYTALDVSGIESPEGKCYKITDFITPFHSGKSSTTFEYLVFPDDALKHYPYVESLRTMVARTPEPEDVPEEHSRMDDISETENKPRPKQKPLLDLF